MQKCHLLTFFNLNYLHISIIFCTFAVKLVKCMKYIVGRRNLACTIFVPFDCDNNCPFCTSKKMYKDFTMDLEGILDKIKQLNKNNDIKEYVLTGGEPFANLETTKIIIGAMEKRCFINTTLPMAKNINEVIEYINTEEKIRGINVSRHIGFTFKGVADIDLINRINKPIRVNTVINKNFTFDKFKEFVNEWGSEKRMINLRADYTKLDTTSLKARDEIETFLSTEYLYMGSGGCLVCHSVTYDADNCLIQYHRGLMFSSVKMGEKTYVNDVIITPDGKLYKDWDFKEDAEFNNWILIIPDIKETDIVVTVDWINDGTIRRYYYQGETKDMINLTEHPGRSVKINNKARLDSIMSDIKKQVGKSLVNIKAV